MIKFLLTLSASCFLFVLYLKSNSLDVNQVSPYTSEKEIRDKRTPTADLERESSNNGRFLNNTPNNKKHLDTQKPRPYRQKRGALRQARQTPDAFNANDSRQALEDIIDLSNQNINGDNEEMVYENLSVYLKRYDDSLSVDDMPYVIKIVGQLIEHDPSNAPEELLYFQLENLNDEEKKQSFSESGLTTEQIKKLQDRLISYGYILDNGNG